MLDNPGSPLDAQPAVRLNISRVNKAFRTAVFSAAGVDAGMYYGYQDWFCEYEKGSETRLTLGWDGKDPGQDFKDAVDLWCDNHSFTLPTLPTPPYHPPLVGMKRYTIRAGDTLQSLAYRFYGDEAYATLILKQNMGEIPSPFLHTSPFSPDTTAVKNAIRRTDTEMTWLDHAVRPWINNGTKPTDQPWAKLDAADVFS
jgi:hypothetical protein